MVLKGKIIKILDNTRVIVDLGFEDGIKQSMKFFVYSEGEEIKNPETNEVLGKIELVKHRLKVVHIQETFSIMASDQYRTARSFFSTFSLLMGDEGDIEQVPFKLEKTVETKSEDLIIRVGDLVRQDVTE
jgi:hypothetical protein